MLLLLLLLLCIRDALLILTAHSFLSTMTEEHDTATPVEPSADASTPLDDQHLISLSDKICVSHRDRIATEILGLSDKDVDRLRSSASNKYHRVMSYVLRGYIDKVKDKVKVRENILAAILQNRLNVKVDEVFNDNSTRGN